MLGCHLDITDRKRIEKELANSKNALDHAQQISHLGSWDWNIEDDTATWSDEQYRLFGYEPGEIEPDYNTFTKALHPEDRDRVLAAVKATIDDGDPYDIEFRIVCPDKTERTVQAQGRVYRDAQNTPVRMIGTTFDITARKELEKQFVQAQKMEAIGRLASGIAHDFNNIISLISGIAELNVHKIQNDQASPEALIDCFNNIIKATDRAKHLTGQVLGFAKKGKYNPEDMDFNIVIKELVGLLRKGFASSHHYSIEYKLEARKFIHGDANQMHQVIQNLAVNARDAMPEGGEITITTEDVTLMETFGGQFTPIPPGEYLKLAVTDTGCGIKDEDIPLIFDPFFTTKNRSSGAGLGLSTTWGIVRNHNGYIDLRTVVGKGTTFDIYFPAVDPVAVQEIEKEPVLQKGKGKILFVDDEPILRETTAGFLKILGYDVVEAANGEEALEIYRGGGFDLVLTDLIMQPMDGAALFDEIIRFDPNVNLYVLSGFHKDEVVQSMLEKGAKGFLEKPVRFAKLEATVKTALSQGDR